MIKSQVGTLLMFVGVALVGVAWAVLDGTATAVAGGAPVYGPAAGLLALLLAAPGILLLTAGAGLEWLARRTAARRAARPGRRASSPPPAA